MLSVSHHRRNLGLQIGVAHFRDSLGLLEVLFVFLSDLLLEQRPGRTRRTGPTVEADVPSKLDIAHLS